MRWIPISTPKPKIIANKKDVEKINLLKISLEEVEKDVEEIRKSQRSQRRNIVDKDDIEELKEEVEGLREFQKNVGDASERKFSSALKGIEKDVGDIRESQEKVQEASDRKGLKIDSGVGVLIDTDFNNFLTDVKVTLSNRVRKKEEEIDDTLKLDLVKKNKEFKQK